MTIPPAPPDPTYRTLVYDDPTEVTAALGAWKTRDAAQTARIAELEAQIPKPAPTPILWGSSVMPYPPEKPADALARVEKQFSPDLIRDFTPGMNGPVWPSDLGSHRLAISWKAAPADVISGKFDQQITAWANACPAQYTADDPAYATYWHEPENDGLNPAQYRQAWAHFARLVRATGKPIRLVLILMEFTLRDKTKNWQDYFEPDAVDVLGWDCYMRPGRTPADVYSRPRAVSTAAGKPWAVCETAIGSTEFPTATQRQTLLTAMAKELSTTKPLPEFVTYFDSDPGKLPGYGWNISRTPAAVQAWRAGQSA